MVASTSALTWFFVGALLCGFCAPDPLDDLNININIKDTEQKGIDQAVPSRTNDEGVHSTTKAVHSTTTKPPKDNCFEYGLIYMDEPLNKPGSDNNYGPTGSAKGCQRLCQNTRGCAWFNWAGEYDRCWLKTGKGDTSDYRLHDVTGPRSCEPALSCPAFHINTGDRQGEEVFKDIGSPETCKWKCRGLMPLTNGQRCKAWTWANSDAGEFSLNCVLMSGYGYTYSDKHVISAQNGCEPWKLSCPSVNLNTRKRRGEEVLVNIESAEECSEKCRAKISCNSWTWANKDAGQYALDCVLMTGYEYTFPDKNVISGKRTCNPKSNCFEYDLRYKGEPLNKPGGYGNANYGPTGSAKGCQRLCQNTEGCEWFNYFVEYDQCWLETGKGNTSEYYRGDVTGPRICERRDQDLVKEGY